MAVARPMRDRDSERSEFAERLVKMRRVAKVVKGGRRFSFSALVVVGDLNGRVGVGLGKAREMAEAHRKAVDIAKRSLITVPLVGTTIPHEINLKHGAAKILLKPAAPGTGVIAGGGMRAVIELAGIKDVLAKSLGTNNPANTVHATMEALQKLRQAGEVASARGKNLDDLVGRKLASVLDKKAPAAAAPEAAPAPDTTPEGTPAS